MRTRHVILLGMAGFARIATLQAADDEMSMMAMGGPGAKLDPKQIEFFEKKVQPILKGACYKCHSVEEGKSKGGLTLDTREGLAKGGETGKAVVPGDPEKSLLVTAVTYKDPDLQMPPKGEKLSAEQIKTLTEWVKMGAPDSRKAASAQVAAKLTGLTDKARSHWAYQPVKNPALPTVKNGAWCVTPIDRFILEKIEAKGMVPSPGLMDGGVNTINNKGTLLRRAYYDLIGLPPTYEEFAAFAADSSPNAFEKVIDKLLASPHYGERWGRFWLDTARYSDTIGGDGNNNRQDYRYPYAWTYRDWVIKALNADMPYDKFVTQQLAADLIPKNPVENLAALGFLTVGERFGNPNDVINDRIDTVTKGFLAMTVACSRCHDHMFDPIPTSDYYALHGVFSSIFEPTDKPLIAPPPPKELKEDYEKQLAALEQENRDRYFKLIGDTNEEFWSKAASYLIAGRKGSRNASAEDQKVAEELRRAEKLDGEIANVIGRQAGSNNPVFAPMAMFARGGRSFGEISREIAANKGGKFNALVAAAFNSGTPGNLDEVAQIYGRVFADMRSKGREYIKAAAAAKSASDQVTGFDAAVVQLVNTPFSVELASKLDTPRMREVRNGLPQQIGNRAGFVFGKINNLLITHPGTPVRAMTIADKPQPQNSAVMIRGQAETRGDEVPRRFLEVLSPGGRPTPFRAGSGRLELAHAIASKNNPLTPRVIVNRVWLHHFGEGFVRTPDDLGTMSEAPTHPELIDHLSRYLMDQNWSLKRLHKYIMMSKVYQISSHTVAAHETIDPENRLLWRANVRRLDFEAMRDSLLAFSGKLDRTIGGKPVNITDEPYSFRRSVYGYIDRGNIPELMAHFDFARPDMPNSKRSTTVVPQQALFLMNSPMAADVARSVLTNPIVARAKSNVDVVNAIHGVLFQRVLNPSVPAKGIKGDLELALNFLAQEKKNEAQVAQESKALTENAAKRAQDRYNQRMSRDNDAEMAIQNKGKLVERKVLTPWESYVQALLMTNEAAYVN